MPSTRSTSITHHSLQIHLRVPVRVIYDDNICCGKINTKTTSSCRQHKDKLLTARGIIFVDLSLPILVRCLSIQSTILKKQILISALDMFNELSIVQKNQVSVPN